MTRDFHSGQPHQVASAETKIEFTTHRGEWTEDVPEYYFRAVSQKISPSHRTSQSWRAPTVCVVFIRLTTRRGLEMSISMYTSRSNGNKKVMNYHKRFMRDVMCHYMAKELRLVCRVRDGGWMGEVARSREQKRTQKNKSKKIWEEK